MPMTVKSVPPIVIVSPTDASRRLGVGRVEHDDVLADVGLGEASGRSVRVTDDSGPTASPDGSRPSTENESTVNELPPAPSAPPVGAGVEPAAARLPVLPLLAQLLEVGQRAVEGGVRQREHARPRRRRCCTPCGRGDGGRVHRGRAARRARAARCGSCGWRCRCPACPRLRRSRSGAAAAGLRGASPPGRSPAG